MWLQLLSILPNLVGRASDHFKYKRELKNAVAVKKLEILEAKETADIQWEKAMAEGTKESWKDEFWTLLFGYLLLSPLWDPQQTLTVFRTFGEAPEWFQLCVLVSVGASFGVKIWKNLK